MFYTHFHLFVFVLFQVYIEMSIFLVYCRIDIFVDIDILNIVFKLGQNGSPHVDVKGHIDDESGQR